MTSSARSRATYAEGITAVQIVDVFTSRGIKFSEASFRKYVQQGLLPRSRRVGRKGKHRGSLGVYPAKTVRRINTVKQLMADGHTIEEIQGQFLLYTDLVEGVAENLAELWTRLDRRRRAPRAQAASRALERELAELRRDGDAWSSASASSRAGSRRHAPTASVLPAPRGAPRTFSNRQQRRYR